MGIVNRPANIITAIVCMILCVRFSGTYFSYALDIFVLFILYDYWTHRKNTWPAISWKGAQTWLLGVLLFYSLCFISSALLGDGKSIQSVGHITAFSLPFFMLYFLRSRYESDKGVYWGLLLGMLMICLGAFFVPSKYLGLRMTSFFNHPNDFGGVLELLLPFAMWYLIKSKQAIIRISLMMLLILMFYCLWRTESRGAMVALAAGIGLSFFVMAIVQRKAIGIKKLAALTVSACVVLAAGAGLLYGIQSTRSERSARGGERIEMLEASYEMWQDHKLLGVGFANWQENYYSERYHPKSGIEENLTMPHNMPIYFFSTMGSIGGAGYLAFFIFSFTALYRAAGRTRDKWLAAAALAAFFAFHIHGLVDSTITNKVIARLFYGLMGYSLAAMLSETDQEKRISQ